MIVWVMSLTFVRKQQDALNLLYVFCYSSDCRPYILFALICLPMPDYYKILDLPLGASKAEIKKAYRKKVMQYHPDRNPSSEAQALFIQLTEAYETLMGEAPANRRKARQPPTNQTDHYAFY